MKLEEFDFELPEELIAQHPTEKRDESRLLVLHKKSGEIDHRHFYDIIDYLHEGDVLVRMRVPLRQCESHQERDRHPFFR